MTASEASAGPAQDADGAGWGLRDPETVALVCFSGRVDIPWLRLLKPGFRHCMVMLRVFGVWVIYDPLAHHSLISVGEGYSVLGLSRALRKMGVVHVLTRPEARPVKRALPWRPYTCVEAIKRVLGLRAPAVFTPWQLYQQLRAVPRPEKLTEGIVPSNRP